MKQATLQSGKIKIYTDHEPHIALGTLKYSGIAIDKIASTNGFSKKNGIEQHKKIIDSKKDKLSLPLVNIKSFEQHYIIEIYIPGIQKQDMEVGIDKNVLYIKVAKKKSNWDNNITYLMKEFNYDYIEREINLPKNSEPSLAQIEFHDGTLVINIPKTKHEVLMITSLLAIH
jgi:HSP20 family molecular chaperone IbpA